MKKGAAWLLCLLLLVTLILPVRAEGQQLLYPGVTIQGDNVYLVGMSMDGGSIQATANGTAVGCTSLSLQETQLGVTYYCVASISSSLSDVQREQQRSGLIAISDALGPEDSMVLVTMGREVTFSEKLTDSAARTEAIDQLTYATFGVNLYEGIYNVLNTAEQSGELCSVVFFTDGCDHSDVVRYTQEQAGQIVQNSGLSVSFLVLLTPPVSDFATARAELMQQYAAGSAGGIYHAPLLEDNINYITVMENAAREVVSQSGSWTVYRFDATQLPRDSAAVELSVTWTNGETSMTGTAQVDTASLPALPEPTQPETEPETVPETTLPPQTEATEADIPEFQPDNESKTLYYVAIGGAAAAVLVLLLLLISTLRRSAKRRKRASRPAVHVPAPDALANRFVPTMPKEPETETPAPAPEAIPEIIEETPAPAEPEVTEAAPAPAEPEVLAEPAPAEPEAPEATAPEAPEVLEEAAPAEPEAAAPAAPEISEEKVPEEAPEKPEASEAVTPAEPKDSEENFSLDMLDRLVAEFAPEEPTAAASKEAPVPVKAEEPEAPAAEPAPAPEEISTPAQPEAPAAPAEPEDSGEPFSLEKLEALLTGFAPEEPEASAAEPAQTAPEEPMEVPVRPEPPKQAPAQTRPEPPRRKVSSMKPENTVEPMDLPGPSRHRHSLFHRRERWVDDVSTRQEEAPAVVPEPKAPAAVPSCTVRLMPEGNPGGSVYVTMEPNSSRTLGRNQKADIILNKSDRCLSGLHFELQWDGRTLYLTDRNSTNGTAITGVIQRPGHWARVENGATIRAGNVRYKVRITKN